jgi:hypothetical protein
MANFTDPRTGESVQENFAREPIKPPPGDLADPVIVNPPVYRSGVSMTSIVVGILALIAIVFVFMSMDRGPAPPPAQQTSENAEPAPPPPALPTPPAQPTVQ